MNLHQKIMRGGFLIFLQEITVAEIVVVDLKGA